MEVLRGQYIAFKGEEFWFRNHRASAVTMEREAGCLVYLEERFISIAQ